MNEQRIRDIVRQELMDYVSGAAIGDNRRLHRVLCLFYHEMELHRVELDAADQVERRRILKELGDTARLQEWDEARVQMNMADL